MDIKALVGKLLQQEKQLFPLAEPQDYYKVVYQSIMGAGHLISDPTKSLLYLQEEWVSIEPDPSAPLFQDISLNMPILRLNLARCKADLVPLSWIADSFFKGANLYQNPLKDDFHSVLLVFRSMFTGFDLIPSGEKNEYPPLHHSKTYRDLYHPNYRVIPNQYLIPGLSDILFCK